MINMFGFCPKISFKTPFPKLYLYYACLMFELPFIIILCISVKSSFQQHQISWNSHESQLCSRDTMTTPLAETILLGGNWVGYVWHCTTAVSGVNAPAHQTDVTELAATKADRCAPHFCFISAREPRFYTPQRLQPEANRLVRCASAQKEIHLCGYANSKMLCMLCQHWINDIKCDTMLVCLIIRKCLPSPLLTLSLSLSLSLSLCLFVICQQLWYDWMDFAATVDNMTWSDKLPRVENQALSGLFTMIMIPSPRAHYTILSSHFDQSPPIVASLWQPWAFHSLELSK